MLTRQRNVSEKKSEIGHVLHFIDILITVTAVVLRSSRYIHYCYHSSTVHLKPVPVGLLYVFPYPLRYYRCNIAFQLS